MPAFEIGARNGDQNLDGLGGQMLPQFSTIQAQPTTRTEFTVDVQTPELPNPMERIKQKGVALRKEKIQ